MKMKKVAQMVAKKARDNLPGILTAVSVVGTWSAMIFGIKATPKAMEHIEKKKKELQKDKLTIVETVQACGKDYIPAVGSAVVATASGIASAKISMDRTAAVAGLCAATQEALSTYQNKVVETLGETKEQKLYDAAQMDRAKKIIDNSPLKDQLDISHDGKYITIDAFSGRAFWCNIDTINNTQAAVNKTAWDSWDNQTTLNDMYTLLDDPVNLPPLEMGNHLGFGRVGSNMELLDFKVTHGWYREGIPCIVLNYQVWDLYSGKPMT